MARKKSKKIDLSTMEPLSQNPFAALGEKFGVTSVETRSTKEPRKESGKTKASILIRLEKRKHGRQATCIYHVGGDGKALLKKLKQRLGTGGSLSDDGIEVQGDHREKAATFFQEEGFKVRRG